MKQNYSIVRRWLCVLCVLALLWTSAGTVGNVRAVDDDVGLIASYRSVFQNIYDEEEYPLIRDSYAKIDSLFTQNPAIFLKALSLEEPHIQEAVAILFLLANDFGAKEGFAQKMAVLESVPDKSEEEVEVITKILYLMNQYNQERELAVAYTMANAPFHRETIREMIKVNCETESVDEAFFHVIADAYLCSPSYFSESIADMASEDIQFVAKAIAYDLQKTGRQSLAVMPGDCETAAASAVARLICTEVSNPCNASFETLASTYIPNIVAPANVQPRDLGWTTISAFSLSSTTVLHYERVNAYVTISTMLEEPVPRNYTVKIYRVNSDGSKVLITSSSTTIPGNRTTVSLTISVPLNTAGQYTLRAELYNSSGVQIHASSGRSVTVKGVWKINAVFRSDRSIPGVLTMYNTYGAVINSWSCLGQSTSNGSMYVENGNTPTGEAWAQLEGPHCPDVGNYGPNMVVALVQPIFGIIRDSGRTGILIHGSYSESADGGLQPTNGCIRVRNATSAALQTQIQSFQVYNNRGKVIITEE